jgi:hypothetical protein
LIRPGLAGFEMTGDSNDSLSGESHEEDAAALTKVETRIRLTELKGEIARRDSDDSVGFSGIH